MTKYKINFKQSVAKDLRKIPNSDVKKILTRIETLAINPRDEGCVKLTGEEKYRVRQGTYRIIYEMREMELVVAVIKIGHRYSVYKNK